jgi:hypothetical protein
VFDTNIVGIRRQVYRFDFSQQLPDIFYPIFYDTFYKAWLHFESAWLGLIYIGICGSIVVILLQGCIFDACGSYHITPSLYFREEVPRMIGRVAAVDPETLPVRAM